MPAWLGEKYSGITLLDLLDGKIKTYLVKLYDFLIRICGALRHEAGSVATTSERTIAAAHRLPIATTTSL